MTKNLKKGTLLMFNDSHFLYERRENFAEIGHGSVCVCVYVSDSSCTDGDCCKFHPYTFACDGSCSAVASAVTFHTGQWYTVSEGR